MEKEYVVITLETVVRAEVADLVEANLRDVGCRGGGRIVGVHRRNATSVETDYVQCKLVGEALQAFHKLWNWRRWQAS